MSVSGMLRTHAVAHSVGKPPFFFSRFNFEQMKELGNTHYCFHCGGWIGFIPDENGQPTNCVDGRGYNSMKNHNTSHSDGVIGDADLFDFVGDWLESKIHSDFPYVVSVP